MTKTYRLQSWIDPRIDIRAAPGRGKGSFARAPIRAGEIVTVWGGPVFTTAEVKTRKTKKCSFTAITENLHMGSPANLTEPGPAHYLNHSCDPNVWMVDEVTLAARRDIAKDEELVADYAMWEECEHHVRRLPELQ